MNKMKTIGILAIVLLLGSLIAAPLALAQSAGVGGPVNVEAKSVKAFDRSSITANAVSGSASITEVAEESGVDISLSDLAELDNGSKEKGIVIAIIGSGPEVKFVILEKKYASIAENPEDLTVEKAYRGRIKTSDNRNLFVAGKNLDELDVLASNLASTTSDRESRKVIGKAKVDLSNKMITLTLESTQEYKVDTIKRKVVRRDRASVDGGTPVPERFDQVKRKSIFDRLFPGFRGDSVTDTDKAGSDSDKRATVSEESNLVENGKRPSFIEWVKSFFTGKAKLMTNLVERTGGN